jgi:hypothetical protein
MRIAAVTFVLVLAGCSPDCPRETPEQTIKRMRAECALAFAETDVEWCLRNRLAQRP